MKTEFEKQIRILSTQNSVLNIAGESSAPANDQPIIKCHDRRLPSPSDVIINLKV